MKDDTLVLYYYNDGLSESERRKVADALREDSGLAARYQTLSRDLDALSDPPDVPISEGLEYRLKSALQREVRLEEEAAFGHGGLRGSALFARRSFAWGGALAAALAVGIGIGSWLNSNQPPGPQVVELTLPQDSVEWSPVAFQRGLETHFRSGRSEIADLSGQVGADRAALVASLMQQNRLYARLALQNDAPEVARVLRSFEPILAQLAREDLSEQDIAALQSQLEFEFTVMLTKLARDSSQKAESHTQEMSL